MAIALKRAYDDAHKNDGVRVLVDHIWPRGVSKDKARFDHWFKGLAPSDDLRKWFDHDPARWATFKRRYFKELDQQPDDLDPLKSLVKQHHVTLVYAARDEAHNNAVALKAYLEDR